MSNPYESIFRAALPSHPENSAPAESSVAPAPAQTQSTVLSKVAKSQRLSKPPMRFNVRPRFRFDLPEPPMDPKMLLGRLSTAAYTRPHVSALEKNFRPVAFPGDPTYGLRANLVESSLYAEPATLSIDDDALLLSVMAGRSGPTDAKNVAEASRRTSQKPGLTPNRPTALSSAPTPWMRRMSYDEYKGGSLKVTRPRLTAKEEADVAAKLADDRKNDPEMQQRRRRAMLQSFTLASRNPVHPDKRKARLTPVHVTPLFPDFDLLGEEFVSLEFDQNEKLEHPEHKLGNAEDVEESVGTLATMPVGNAWKEAKGDKCAACYVPADDTLAKRKRLREEEDGPTSTERDKKRIHFGDTEDYLWIGEYSVRESQLGKPRSSGAPARSCYALAEEVSTDQKARVAFLSRIASSWKLNKRPGTAEHLGKPVLRIMRESDGIKHEETKKRKIAGPNEAKPVT